MSLSSVANGEAFQRHRETVERITADRVDEREDEDSSESEIETEFEEFEDEDSESESVGQVEVEEAMKSYFAKINARRANEPEPFIISSCVSAGDDGAVRHECVENDVDRILELAVRVLWGRAYKGQELPIMGRDIIEIKRNEMSDRQLASRHVDTAKASARALLHVAFLQSKLPYVCARQVAQFFQPQLSLRDVQRSFYRHEGPVRSTCVDMFSLRLAYPSWFDFARNRTRKRQRVLDSKRHALWCYVAWASMFAAWAPLDEVGDD